ncbi:MAG: hypothetical protein SFT91_06430 [Rickettsiaceae bacterium]|nr:hypothetical protein [Rickettsiaceae bacterium]
MTKNQVAKSVFYEDAPEFIPVCCHYDANTLITKNGELLQTIRIDGIGLHKMNPDLPLLRQKIRESLVKNINSTKIACWIHTTRRKDNLDDGKKFTSEMCQHIHDIWMKKNFWNDKYVNTLYLTITYSSKDLEVRNFNDLMRNLSFVKLATEHDAYLDEAKKVLDSVVVSITEDLKEFYPKKIGIYFDEENSYCEILSLFYGILRGIEKPIMLQEGDLSKIIGEFNYGVGFDKLEIISEKVRKYASILTIKQYQELSEKTLDDILQIPTEFVITEAFYFITPDEGKRPVTHQDYILKISHDENVAKSKKINTVLEAEQKYKLPYCNQQISILLLNQDMNKLDQNSELVSQKLFKQGLLHVKEDAHIEKIFWSQIPGNFKYFRKLVPTSIENIAPFSCLHYMPYGSNDQTWGGYISLFRTSKGTPYFFNFHSKAGNARTLIAGVREAGKTSILNFAHSQLMKFDPASLLITFAKNSFVFVSLMKGKWHNTPFNLDFFKIESIASNDIMIKGILRAMILDQSDTIPDQVEAAFKELTDYIFSIPKDQRSFEKISEFDFTPENRAGLKSRMAPYLKDGEFYPYFCNDEAWDGAISKISAIDFSEFSDEAFIQKHYPKEDRFLPEYYKNYNKFVIFRELLVAANIFKFNDKYSNENRIIRNDDFNMSCSGRFPLDYYKEYFAKFAHNEVIFTCAVNFSEKDPFFDSILWGQMQEMFETKMYLSAELVTSKWKEKLFLSDHELKTLQGIIVASRLFMTKQDQQLTLCELSLGGYPNILKILSSDKKIIESYNQLVEKKGADDASLYMEFYNSLS